MLERRVVELGEERPRRGRAGRRDGSPARARRSPSCACRRAGRAIEQVLVHADRAVDLALAAEQRAEREVQVDRLRIDLDDLDERLDRLVGLLVQQEVEAAEVRQRQRARLAQQVLDVDARGDPAQREEQRRDRQQPPELEVHGAPRIPSSAARSPVPTRGRCPAPAPCGVGATTALRCSRRSRFSWRFSRATLIAPARRPSATPVANAISTTKTSGASQLQRLKKRSVTGSAFCSERNSSDDEDDRDDDPANKTHRMRTLASAAFGAE